MGRPFDDDSGRTCLLDVLTALAAVGLIVLVGWWVFNHPERL